MTKLVIIALALAAVANTLAPDRSDPPLLIDSQPSAATSIDASN